MLKNLFLAAVVATAAAPMAFAKAHNQGMTDDPGQTVKTQTVSGAQTLGGVKGNRPDDRGPTKSRAVSGPR